MSNPPNDFNTNTTFNKYKGSYFNDDVDVSGGDIINRTGDLYLACNSSIYTSANRIQFDDTYLFTNFLNSVNISGQLKLTYNSTEYDVGERIEKIQDIYNNKIGTMLYNSQYDFSEFNNIYCSGQIQYEDSNGAHVDLVPIVLSNQSGLSTTNSNITTLQGKTTNIAYDSGTNTTTITGLLTLPTNSINSTSINNTSFLALTGNQTITSGIKTFSTAPVLSGASITTNTIPIASVVGTAVALSGTQTITATKTFSVQQNFSNNIRIDGSLLCGSAGSTVVTNTQLQLIPAIATISARTGALSYTLGTTTTTIADNTSLTNVSFSGNINSTFTKAQFDNAINRTNSLTVNCQDTLTSLQSQITNFSGVSLSAINTFSGAFNTFTNNIRLDGSLLLNAGAMTITNTTLQYISGLTSNCQTQLNNLITKLTNTTYNSTYNATTISNTLSTDIFHFQHLIFCMVLVQIFRTS